MRKLILIASAAAMAAAMPAVAEKGGKGGGQGGGKGQAAHVQGHGGGKPDKAEKRGGGKQASEAAKPRKAERQAFRGGGKPDKAERRIERASAKPDKAFRREVKREERLARDRFDDDRRRDVIDLRRLRDGERRFVALEDDCPPGLAKKRNGCLPPGQAKKMFAIGDRIQPTWFSGYDLPMEHRSFYHDTPDYYYRYDDDGYIYRVDSGSNLISGLIPLFGGGFGVGQPLPAGYDVYNVPFQYRDDYYDTDDYRYRYADDAIYRVDGQTGIIESIVALLAGDLNVGQMLPTGYDAYNVPLDYRDQYYDTDEHLYRYADGNIYQVDAKTQMIQAIVEMLT